MQEAAMTADYGQRRRRRVDSVAVLGLAAVVVGAVTFTAWEGRDWLQRRQARAATARAWTLAGPPCPTLTAGEFAARGLKAPKGFEFEGVTMRRQFGHVSCQGVRTHGGVGLDTFPVCQFTGPRALHVTTARGDFYFDPGVSTPATVSTEGGAARCVLASRFRLEGGRLTHS